MLQRAASNAYSWWWASHIRTKQSKWLEQNLHDMEEKVNHTIQIIEQDGDTFAQRAEMYYRKRPELLNFVEELYRSYRALAERYDHLSRELQSANRTIASVFPERVQLSMDEEDDENFAKSFKDTLAVPDPSIPKVPEIPRKDFRSTSMVMARKKQLNKIASSVTKASSLPRSGLSKSEALEEIDRLQKGILALQTETEFVKSSYENAYAKYWDFENQITEMQQKVCGLEDEFGIGSVIDDNEARTLMATTALKSCQETLVRLQEKHQESADEAKIDHQRIKAAQEKFAILAEHEFVSADLELNDTEQQEKHDLELFREKIKKQLEVNSNTPLTVSQLAEKIDELVGKVTTLETGVSSQTALVKRLRSETDELMARIRSLEEKEDLIENSDNQKNRINALEEELCRAKALNQSVKDQNKNLLTQFTEATCNIDHFIQKLQKVKLEEEVEDQGLFQEVKAVPDDKSDKGVDEEHDDKLAPGDSSGISEEMQREQEDTKDVVLSNSVKAEGDNYIESGPSDVSTQEEKDEKKDLSETTDSNLDDDIEEMGTEEEGEEPNWRHMFINGLEDREKILLDEYSSVLKNYKDVKMKLGDVEKKNRDGFFELALQIRELKNAVFMRDEEIQSLRQKKSPPGNNPDETPTEYNQEGAPESINLAASSLNSSLSSPISHQHTVSDSVGDKIKAKHVDKPQEILTIEEKVRLEIDELLEENLEFWLRFSTSFHQIKKFQTSVRDLKAELLKLKDRMKQEGSGGKQQSLNSDGRPIYKHMREIQTELTLWLENNGILKDELHGRYSSLCNIQQEISRVSNAGSKAEDELSEYQAAKFQGEILNMKQENTKVADELQAGLDRVRVLKAEVEKILAILDEDLGISASRTPSRSSSSRPRIPLRSFLFGVKLKKQKQQKQQKPSLLSCINPALQKQYSDLEAAGRLPQ